MSIKIDVLISFTGLLQVVKKVSIWRIVFISLFVATFVNKLKKKRAIWSSEMKIVSIKLASNVIYSTVDILPPSPSTKIQAR